MGSEGVSVFVNKIINEKINIILTIFLDVGSGYNEYNKVDV